MYVGNIVCCEHWVERNVFRTGRRDKLRLWEVANVSGESITINEVTYNEETGEEAYEEVTYTIMQDAELENVLSIEALEEGKEVDIEYVEKDGKKVINYIYVYTGEE